MKEDEFKASELSVKAQVSRDGPPLVFLVWKPHVTRLFTDVKALVKWVAWPAKTPTGEAFRDWLAQYGYERPGKKEVADTTKTII
jgi:hypothetical protein